MRQANGRPPPACAGAAASGAPMVIPPLASALEQQEPANRCPTSLPSVSAELGPSGAPDCKVAMAYCPSACDANGVPLGPNAPPPLGSLPHGVHSACVPTAVPLVTPPQHAPRPRPSPTPLAERSRPPLRPLAGTDACPWATAMPASAPRTPRPIRTTRSSCSSCPSPFPPTCFPPSRRPCSAPTATRARCLDSPTWSQPRLHRVAPVAARRVRGVIGGARDPQPAAKRQRRSQQSAGGGGAAASVGEGSGMVPPRVERRRCPYGARRGGARRTRTRRRTRGTRART